MALRVKINPEKIPDRSQPLSVHKLSVTRGAREVLREVSLELAHGEILGIVGENGSGKTTLVETLAGIAPLGPHAVQYHHALHDGREIMSMSPAARYDSGLHCVFENRRLFGELTVQENLACAMPYKQRMQTNARLKDVLELFPKMSELMGEKAKTLNAGQQQIVAIARAIMFFPSVLILDEPTRSLPPSAIEALHQVLTVLVTGAIGVMICERNEHFVDEIAERKLILSGGKFVEPVTTSSRASEWKPQ